MKIYLFLIISIFGYTINAQNLIKISGHIGSATDTIVYWFNNNKNKAHLIIGSKNENYSATIKINPKDSLISFSVHGKPYGCEQALKTRQILSYLKHNTNMRYDLILLNDFCESTMECISTDEQQNLEFDWINSENHVLKLKDCSNYEREIIVEGTTYVERGNWSIREGYLIQLNPKYCSSKETGALTEASEKTILSIKDDLLVSKENVIYKKKTISLEEFLKKH